MAEETIVMAKHSFMYEDEHGTSYMLHKGATVRVGHPILVGRDDLFEPFHLDFEHEVPSPGRRVAKKAAPAPELPLGGDS